MNPRHILNHSQLTTKLNIILAQEHIKLKMLCFAFVAIHTIYALLRFIFHPPKLYFVG